MYSFVKNKGLRIFLKTVSWVLIAAAAAIVIFTGAIFWARLVNKSKISIKTENGIQEETYVELGGIEQFIRIRGEDKSNTVILFLHGGPGSPFGFLSAYFQRNLEDAFTFVHWDQRAAGRTFYKNPEYDTSGLSFELLQSDLHELVEYLKNRFGQEKIVIMGHSWGTVLGSVYSLRHPENVLAYVGVGQVVNGKSGDLAAAGESAKLAAERGNETDAEKLREISESYAKTENLGGLDIPAWTEMRALTAKYLTPEGQISNTRQLFIGGVSPELGWEDFKWFLKLGDIEGAFAMQKGLMEYAVFGFDIYDFSLNYEVPVYFITGEGDWTTPRAMSEEYFARITAPDKKYSVIKNTGHSPMLDNPAAFQDEVRKLLAGYIG